MKAKSKIVDVPRLLYSLDMHGAVKRGVKWHALCPVHNDRKASWNIRDEPGESKHGVHGCWSCGWTGDPIELARRVLGLGTRAIAREWVEANAIAVSEDAPLAFNLEIVSPTQVSFRMPPGVRFDHLSKWPSTPREYLAQRGITSEDVDRWKIGYAFEGKLSGRIVFPIQDSDERLLSYTARSFLNAPLRYRTPAAAEAPDPGAMWGELHWPPVGQRGHLWLSEGAINCLAIEKVASEIESRDYLLGGRFYGEGVGVGATGGASSLTIEKLVKISTWRRVTLVADPDPAGDRLTEELSSSLARHSQFDAIRTEGGDAAQIGYDSLLRQLNVPR